MKHALFIVRTAPYGSAAIPESVRSCLGFATMPFEISYLLSDDAVWALAPGQNPEALGAANAGELVEQLADLDVNLYAQAEALRERGLSLAGLDSSAQELSTEGIADLIATADVVMTY